MNLFDKTKSLLEIYNSIEDRKYEDIFCCFMIDHVTDDILEDYGILFETMYTFDDGYHIRCVQRAKTKSEDIYIEFSGNYDMDGNPNFKNIEQIDYKRN